MSLMKKWQKYMTAMALGTLGAVYCASAQDSTTTTTTTLQSTASDNNKLPDSDLYRAQEFSVDLFGVGTIDQHTIDHFTGDRVRHNGVLGGGAGINYFFTRY